ncbi:MAG TPA: hypothetical protein VF974_08055 [Patescibacteria group bacterium]
MIDYRAEAYKILTAVCLDTERIKLIKNLCLRVKEEIRNKTLDEVEEIASEHNGCINLKCAKGNCGETIANEILELKINHDRNQL